MTMQRADFAVTVGGNAMGVAFGLPDGDGPHPTLFVCHHRGGVDAFTLDVVDRMTRLGIAAAAPNFYHRRPPAEDPVESMKSLTDGELVADINAAIDYLAAHPAVDAKRIGTIGHCLGGRISYLALVYNPIFMTAALLYHGNIFESRGAGMPAPFDLTANIKCPVLGLFGRDDPNPSPAMTARLAAAFDRLGIRHAFHTYDATGHAFQDPHGGKYVKSSADDAWVRVETFLKREMVDKVAAPAK
jgi:carboxymethylenebutenolidase